MNANSHRAGIRARAAVVALVVLPFIAAATGAGPALGWLAGLAVLAADWRARLSARSWQLAALAGLTAAAIGPVWYRGSAYHLASFALAACGAALVWSTERLGERVTVVAAVIVSLVGLGAAVGLDPGGYLDVGLMHRAGSEALRAGESPWSGLTVPSGAPGSEGTLITGDPYPPVALGWYSVFDWVTGDPRAGGAVAWALIALASLALRPAEPRGLVLILTSAALPVHLWTGWTELLTIALLSWTVAAWHRPALASVVFGAALSSKQYMVVWAPLVVGNRFDRRVARASVALGAATALALVGFALGEGYLDAIIGVYGRFEARADSASLFGLASLAGVDVPPPYWLGPIAAVSLSLVAAVRTPPRGVDSLFALGAAALSLMFLLGTQAFSNYWFLVGTLGVLANTLGPPTTSTDGLELDGRPPTWLPR